MSPSELPSYRDFLAPEEPFHCAQWRARIIDRCRWFSRALWAHWFRVYEAEGYVAANLRLVSIEERLRLLNTGLSVDSTDEDIVEYAKLKARQFGRETIEAARRYDKPGTVWFMKQLFEQTGLKLPLEDKHWKHTYDGEKVVAAMAKIQDPAWIARQLRTVATRQLEQIARELGLVKRSSSPYLSDFTLRRKLCRRNSNRKLLEKLIATNDLGQTFTLAELSDLGVSNPVNRRNELMVRLKGFEQWAEESTDDYVAMFYTITTPSKFHPLTVRGGRVVPNRRYAGASPTHAEDYLQSLWARARSKLKRHKVQIFGVRVAEPHHDGTPHWHLLLFVRREQQDLLTGILRAYAMAEDPTEPGADRHRFEVVRIDPEKGQATGYVAKYVAKNIDGYKVGLDDEAQQDTCIAAVRAACWASVWGIRQFQFTGGPPVTVWRELRRLELEEVEQQLVDAGDFDSAQLRAIHDAADSGDWERFIENMGGACCPRASLPLRAFHLVKQQAGKYGEAVAKLVGLLLNGRTEIRTRLRTWVVTRVRDLKPEFPAGVQLITGPPCGPLDLCQ